MRDASPGFQPDRGLGGFQFAEDAGFQTQGAACIGDLGVHVALDSPSAFAALGPYHAVVGELAVAVGLTAVTTGPHAWPSWRPAILLRPPHPAYTGVLGVVVGLASPSRFTTEIEQDDGEVLLLMATAGRDHALLLALIEEDDRIVERLRPPRR